jgi:origin recognition complex subunit 1
MAVLNLMSSSPVAMYVKNCSTQQKVMLASVVRCVRREGLAEIPWRNVSCVPPSSFPPLLPCPVLLVGQGICGHSRRLTDAQVRSDHDALTRSLLDTNDLLSNSELAIVLSSLLATHAMTQAYDSHKALDDRKVALGMEISEVGRILMHEGDEWRKALAGT